MPADQIDRVAKLPDTGPGAINVNERNAGPIVKLAQTVNEVPGKLVRVVAAVKEQKEAEA